MGKKVMDLMKVVLMVSGAFAVLIAYFVAQALLGA